MKDKILLKMLVTVSLLSIIIISTGVGAGTVALKMDNKDIALPETDGAEKKDSEKEEVSETISVAKLVSQFETDSAAEAGKAKNLEIACSKLNGYEIKPGAVVSFIDVTGPYTEAEGYVNGPVIVSDTQMGEDIAGGVCQVATALYNAGLQGNMGIVERKRHSFPMDYVAVGLDAAIDSPNTDLKLKNNSRESIFVFASADGGKVTIQLFGQPLEGGKTIRIQSNVIKETAPEGEKVTLTDELKDGEQKEVQQERTGYETAVYREHYENDELVNKEFISEDTYPPVQRVVLQGNSNITK